jgi:hypothetical protein
MAKRKKDAKPQSAFKEHGLANTVKAICDEIRELYLWDEVPWVVGYSGGKDSTAVLQLVWLAIRDSADGAASETDTRHFHGHSRRTASCRGVGRPVAREDGPGPLTRKTCQSFPTS